MQTQTGWTQRIARTQAIMSAAWQILWEDKTLLLLPIASSASLMLLTASFAVPAILGALTGASMTDGRQEMESWSYVGMFLFYVVAYGVAIFFNAALAICVLRKLEGKQATILDGLREALSCFPQILGWALVSATIGVVLKTIERRSGFVGNLVARMLGLVWTVATFLVVPVLVAERKGPLDAIQTSVQLLRRTWGEDLLAGLGFGLLYYFWAIPGVFALIIGAGMIATQPMFAIAIMVLAILYFPLLGLVLSTMSTIFDVVLYLYASTGTITPGFDRELLDASFVAKST
ncbi:MAG: DUF6159 family protein [Nitrospirota bacterium]|nr:DUF6159 family protein [Nitrospirota bacterium]MDP2383014.1 DUF6159 family protein [Nitrospirota bacterium]